MDTTINTNIEAIADINLTDTDSFADLDDDPPGLDHTKSDINYTRSPIIKKIKQKIGILTQLALGSLVGGMAGSYIGFPSSQEESRHDHCALIAAGLPAKACPWIYKVG